ncbi:MAG: GNAT family N-acetyltransferase [Planctomycetes bacterium]|nr:GNAT family N-acetyltransferase [Planctomycetota bacterium]
MTRLVTERLVIDDLTSADAGFLVVLLNEPSFLQNIGDRGVRDEAGAHRYLAEGPFASYRRHGFGLWAVRLLADRRPIGICGLLKRDALDDVDIGFAFLPAYWGAGYAQEAAARVLAHAHEELKLPRVVAITAPHNERSAKLLEKLGLRFQREIRLGAEQQPTRLFAPPESEGNP